MARKESLSNIDKKFNLNIISISDLIKYRRKNERLVQEISSVPFPTEFGNFNLKLFEDKVNGDHHVAILKGKISIIFWPPPPVAAGRAPGAPGSVLRVSCG